MRRRGFSFIELLIVVAIVAILAAMATGPLHNALAGARETSAQASIKAIHAAQAQHVAHNGRFARSLAELGPPLNLIGADLATGIKSAYRFTLATAEGGYQVRAEPIEFGVSGRRSFFSDQTLVIRQSSSREPAGPEHAPVD